LVLLHVGEDKTELVNKDLLIKKQKKKTRVKVIRRKKENK